jgi:hypothetical protein
VDRDTDRCATSWTKRSLRAQSLPALSLQHAVRCTSCSREDLVRCSTATPGGWEDWFRQSSAASRAQPRRQPDGLMVRSPGQRRSGASAWSCEGPNPTNDDVDLMAALRNSVDWKRRPQARRCKGTHRAGRVCSSHASQPGAEGEPASAAPSVPRWTPERCSPSMVKSEYPIRTTSS